jgi:ABC-type amino acid transport system permease subunit
MFGHKEKERKCAEICTIYAHCVQNNRLLIAFFFWFFVLIIPRARAWANPQHETRNKCFAHRPNGKRLASA